MEKEKLKKIGKYVFGAVGLVAVFYYLVWDTYYFRYRIFSTTHYVIGEVVDFQTGKAGKRAVYVYRVEGKEYRDSRPLKFFKQLDIGKGDRLYVKFSVDDPNVSVLLNCCKIGGGIVDSPSRRVDAGRTPEDRPLFY